MMKLTKKLASLLLALVLILGLSTTAFAASGTNTNTGKITIDNAVKDQTYTIYQILVLESYDTASGAYSYKAATAWKNFVEGEGIKDVYLATDENGYVTWVDKVLTCTNVEETHKHMTECYKASDVAAFAKLAQAYAKSNSITNQGSTKATGNTVVFDKLNLGWYLVDTTLGTLCSLNTTATEVTIQEKNGAPTVEKEVQEGETWGKANDANIGDTVNFKATINVVDGNPRDYVLHDTMSAGLTFDETSVEVKVGNNTTLTAGKDYTLVTSNLDDKCTFEIRFTAGVLKPNDVVTVTYSATLNNQAVVGLPGNPNTTKLSYKDDAKADGKGETTESKTITYTWDVDVLKYANGDKTNTLQGVKFVLLNSDRTKVAKVVSGKLIGWETVPTDGKTWPANTVLTTGQDGKIQIDGLDSGTYYLREIEALPGFNILPGDEQIVITGATEGEDDTLTYTTKLVEINNQSGTQLPSTGGVGTTIFYILGGALVLGAAVLLITRKRMGQKD